MTSLHGMASLIVSLVALAFVVWIALVHPAQDRVYGPAPAAAVAAML